jgi:iron(III) transport system ATP-binding protein
MLASLGLEGFEARLPAELSGGQQQRVAVARALVLRPQVLLFDEPLSNLDARLRRRVREDIRDLQRKLGLSVVYVTHDQQEALAVSDLVVVMRDGRIAQMGTPTELYEDPADAFVADFMGEANVIAGEVLAAEGGRGRLAIGGAEVEVAMRAHPVGPATLAVRPEAVTLVDAGGVPGRVARAAFLGQTREYEVETAAGMLFVIAPASAPAFAEGAAVGCRLERVIPLRG